MNLTANQCNNNDSVLHSATAMRHITAKAATTFKRNRIIVTSASECAASPRNVERLSVRVKFTLEVMLLLLSGEVSNCYKAKLTNKR